VDKSDVVPRPGHSSIADLDRRQLILITALFALAAVGWIVTDQRMAGMDAGPGTDPGPLGFYVTVWVVMMGAMMFPSIVPMVRVYDLVQRRRHSPGRVGATAAFIGGYLVSWTAFGLVAYSVFVLIRGLDLGVLSWYRGGRYVAAAVLLAGAAYQLTAWKETCLRRCRNPVDFVARHWRPGGRGAVAMGIAHGAWCVGCCWALMASLFALGVMSLGWMAFIALLIAIEKLAPWGAQARRSTAVVLAILGVGVAIFPESVPGLTLPRDSGDQIMETMEP
jgi:predicted metal-binding membrane protein